jgi:FkbM family methyltransferase
VASTLNPHPVLALRTFSRLGYKLLGPSLSTRIALSPLGRALTRHFYPAGVSIYSCDLGLRLELARDEAMLLGVGLLGRPNPIETDLLLEYLRPGDTFVDVGCYVDAWHSLVASRIVGPTGRIVSFEPVPDYAERARRNMRLNGLENMRVEESAVADYSGRAVFAVEASTSRFAKTGIDVTVTTLDEYVATRGLSVNFLKVDAEGAEPLVISGGLRSLASASHVLAEITDPDSPAVGMLEQIGFAAYAITRQGLVPYRGSSETLNVLFIRPTA